MKILIVISSKSPNDILFNCIDTVYKEQINKDTNNVYQICIIDSDSDNFDVYKNVNIQFPSIHIHYVKNKNYEYGAWKYAHELYTDYDIYFCIHDSVMLKQFIDLSVINNNTAYTCHHFSGYYSHLRIKQKGIDNLINSGLNYADIINTHFNLAWGSLFIVNKDVMVDIFRTLKNPPVDKDGSCFYERNFGLYFIIKNINTLDFTNNIIKINGNRQ
jgi:hypothetical protein